MERGLSESREKAKRAIMAGRVTVNEQPARKPSDPVKPQDRLALIAGEKLADRGLLSPWLGMWMADIVLFVLGAWLTLRMGRESPSINWAALRRLVPAYFRAPEEGGPEA